MQCTWLYLNTRSVWPSRPVIMCCTAHSACRKHFVVVVVDREVKIRTKVLSVCTWTYYVPSTSLQEKDHCQYLNQWDRKKKTRRSDAWSCSVLLFVLHLFPGCGIVVGVAFWAWGFVNLSEEELLWETAFKLETSPSSVQRRKQEQCFCLCNPGLFSWI